jgi:hypothetical protein
MLLEYYGLQLQHLSPNSIALVAIFVHLCEMYMGYAIGVTVPALLHAKGCEPTPAVHRRSLLPALDTRPCPLHHAHFPSTMGTVEKRLGTSSRRCPRPACTSRRRPDPRPHRVRERPRPGYGFRPCAGSDPVPSQKQPNFTDGAARLPVKAPRASPEPVPLPRVDVHRGEHHHTAGPRAWA